MSSEWENLCYSYKSEDVTAFNVIFSEYIDTVADNGEQFDSALSMLEAWFHGGRRSQLLESVCALRRLQPDLTKFNAMVFVAAIEKSRWDIVASIIQQHLVIL